jgi:hypothetical protein
MLQTRLAIEPVLCVLMLRFASCALSIQAAIEPVWYMPAVAERFGVSENRLRECLFLETNMMYPELITRPDIKVSPRHPRTWRQSA